MLGRRHTISKTNKLAVMLEPVKADIILRSLYPNQIRIKIKISSIRIHLMEVILIFMKTNSSNHNMNIKKIKYPEKKKQWKMKTTFRKYLV